MRARFPRGDEVGPADVETGDHQDDDRCDSGPVHGADRPLPQVDPVVLAAGRRRLVRQRHAARPMGYAHWTRTLVTTLPVASSTCTPQAMHGSNEWIVRRISSG